MTKNEMATSKYTECKVRLLDPKAAEITVDFVLEAEHQLSDTSSTSFQEYLNLANRLIIFCGFRCTEASTVGTKINMTAVKDAGANVFSDWQDVILDTVKGFKSLTLKSCVACINGTSQYSRFSLIQVIEKDPRKDKIDFLLDDIKGAIDLELQSVLADKPYVPSSVEAKLSDAIRGVYYKLYDDNYTDSDLDALITHRKSETGKKDAAVASIMLSDSFTEAVVAAVTEAIVDEMFEE